MHTRICYYEDFMWIIKSSAHVVCDKTLWLIDRMQIICATFRCENNYLIHVKFSSLKFIYMFT